MNQLTIAFKQRDRGMALATLGAENQVPEWSEQAYAFLKSFAEFNLTFPAFFVTAAAARDSNFPSCVSEKAWGGVWRRALKEGIVAKTGAYMPHPKRHATATAVYRSLVCRV